MSTQTPDSSETRQLDTIQRHIWARINDEINLREIKISIGDAYALGAVIKEVIHPEVREMVATAIQQASIDSLYQLKYALVEKNDEYLNSIIDIHIANLERQQPGKVK